MKTLLAVAGLICLVAMSTSALSPSQHVEPVRSRAVARAFEQSHPCPANGHRRGSCPGYVIDHIIPLCAGGADAVSNMQWQDIADGHAKDKIEWRECRSNSHRNLR